MTAIADEIRNVVYHRDFGVNHRVPPACTAHGEVADAEFVADVHRLPRAAELCGGLRVGVQRGLWVGVQESGQARRVGVVGMLMGDQDGRQVGDALETVGERTRIEQNRGLVRRIVAKVGE